MRTPILYMTKAYCIKTIRGMGLSCVWITDTQEYRVNFREGHQMYHGDDSAYYTNDADDAIGTAIHMKEHL